MIENEEDQDFLCVGTWDNSERETIEHLLEQIPSDYTLEWDGEYKIVADGVGSFSLMIAGNLDHAIVSTTLAAFIDGYYHCKNLTENRKRPLER